MYLGPIGKPLLAHADNNGAMLQHHGRSACAIERNTTAAAALRFEAHGNGCM
jgi:hypothetical protein